MWIHTYLGNRYQYGKINKVYIEDIAHHLSNICRFTGATEEFYSVAQHSVEVSYFLKNQSVMTQLHGLLHDAHEAYTGDINAPLQEYWKDSGVYGVIAQAQDFADDDIYNSLGLPFPNTHEYAKVKQADRIMFATEASQLLRGGRPAWLDKYPAKPLSLTLVPLPPSTAKALFLRRYRELISQIEEAAA